MDAVVVVFIRWADGGFKTVYDLIPSCVREGVANDIAHRVGGMRHPQIAGGGFQSLIILGESVHDCGDASLEVTRDSHSEHIALRDSSLWLAGSAVVIPSKVVCTEVDHVYRVLAKQWFLLRVRDTQGI